MGSYLEVSGGFFCVVFLLFMMSTVVSVPAKTKRGVKSVPQFMRQNVDVKGFLKHYGYMEQKPVGIQDDNNSLGENRAVTLRRAVRKFQQFYGIPDTGELDALTLKKMAMPRCGTKDIERDPRGRVKRFSRLAAKWKHSYLTWKVTRFTGQLPQASQRSTFSRAFQIWQDSAPLTFTETRKEADIEISFVRGNHGDGPGNAFDGRGNILAHAYGPGEAPISGDAHFDDDEYWTLDDERGTNLLVVAAHEFGHSLGLGHSRDARALMYPAYQSQDNLKLGYDDIRGIQTIYGGKIGPNPRTVAPQTRRPRPRVTPRPTSGPATTSQTPESCQIQFDEVVRVDGDNYYGLKDSEVFKFNKDGLTSGYPKPITEIFPEAPPSVDVAFAVPGTSRVYIIKDLKVWRYTKFELDAGYPIEIPRRHFREKPRFVMTFRDDTNYQRVLLFGSDYWWEYDFDNRQTFAPNSYRIRRFWMNVPRDVRYAVQYSDSYFYLVSESSYLVMNHHRRQAVGEKKRAGLPVWLSLPCSSTGTIRSTITVLLVSFGGFLLKVLLNTQ
ncbi:stromelysin-1-like [Gigantopelta aegis]|uniref:stromelysin-1-like n=1 Tax=Gigantopelta aegis TaxID=1735272 RepID=UPI001B88A73E|nr:stromelysin-1-like [Gigantopelta aegis]